MDELPTAMMGFGLGLLTASLTTAAAVGLTPSAVQAQAAPQPIFRTLKVDFCLDAYLILDMTGYADVNDYTLNILYQNIESGNPVWPWGGTD